MEAADSECVTAETRELLESIDESISPGQRHALSAWIDYYEGNRVHGPEALMSAVATCDRGLELDPTFAELHYQKAVFLCREHALRPTLQLT